MRRRYLVITLVAIVALAGLGGGVVAAVHLHAQDVKRARAAAEKQYLAQLTPLTQRVYDAVQPLQDMADALQDGPPGWVQAMQDVAQHGGTLQELASVRASLHQLKPPGPWRHQAKALEDAAEGLTQAVTSLQSVAATPALTSAQVELFLAGLDTLLSAELTWGTAVGDVDHANRMPIADADRARARGRNAPTLGGFIAASDRACSAAEAVRDALPDVTGADRIRTQFPQLASTLRGLVRTLSGTHLPASRQVVEHRLLVELQSVRTGADAFDALSVALRRHDVAGYRAALFRLGSMFSTMRSLSVTYRSLGAGACFEVFAVDDAGNPSAPPVRT